ncbi:hypothetical protein [Thermovibrio sp.]
MGFRSVKLFALLTFAFFLFGFTSLFLAGGILHSLEIPRLFPHFSPFLKLGILALFLSLLLISLQTFYCALFNRFISLLFHSFLALSILLVLLFPITSKTFDFYLYPGTFVELGGKRVALKEVSPSDRGLHLKVFIEKNGKREEGEVSFNSPFESDFGTLWFSGIDRNSLYPAFTFKLLEPTPIPLFLFLSAFLTVLSGLFYTLSSLKREGRNVHQAGREGAPEANRRAP